MKCSLCGSRVPVGSAKCRKCGTPVSKDPDMPTRQFSEFVDNSLNLSFAPGDLFGKRYQIIEEVGRGGMGSVFKARDIDLDILVALKMIHPALMARPGTVERFKKELLIAREISHENVIRIYDFGEIDTIKFISMQYIDGENLAELIRTSGPLSIQTCLNISKGIGQGLQAAHRCGIIHRDLKPQNIMVDKKGRIYITDFGLAKSLEEGDISSPGTVVGTPQYLSPEQARGDKLDQRSDIYALGIIIYEMATGRELFTSDSMMGYLHKHILEKPPNPSISNPLIPVFLEKIILRCLEKEPARRYPRIEALLLDLEKEKASSGTFQVKLGKKKFIWPPLAALLLLGIIFILYSVLGRSGPMRPGVSRNIQAAVLPFKNRTGLSSMDLWEGALPGLLMTDLAQSRILHILPQTQVDSTLEKVWFKGKTDYSDETLKQVAARCRADYVIWGEIKRTGTAFLVSSRIFSVKSGKSTAPAAVWGKHEGDFFPLIDELTRAVKASLYFSSREITGDKDIQVESVVCTGSPEAYKYYWQGDRLHWKGEYGESIRALQRSVQKDPQFTRAFRLMAVDHFYQGEHALAKENLKRAIALIDKAPELERFHIQAFESYLLKESPLEAIDKYKDLLNRYPDNEEGKLQMGTIFRLIEDWENAEKCFLDVLRLNNRSLSACMNLVYIYLARGRYPEAISCLEQFKDLFQDTGIYHRYLAHIRLYQGKQYAEQALEQINKARIRSPRDCQNIELWGIYYHLEGNIAKAEEKYNELLQADSDPYCRVSAIFRLCSLYLMQGRYRKFEETVQKGIAYTHDAGWQIYEAIFYLFRAYLEIRLQEYRPALASVDRALALTPQIGFPDSCDVRKFALYLQGFTYLQMKQSASARQSARELLRLLDKIGSQRQKRLFYLLQGMIALEDGQLDLALTHLIKIEPLIPADMSDLTGLEDRAFFIGTLAEYYELYKLKDEARLNEMVEEIANQLTQGRLRWGDIYTGSFFWLGKFYEDINMKEEAIKKYRTFLRLWQSADVQLPLVRKKLNAARQRLAALTAGDR